MLKHFIIISYFFLALSNSLFGQKNNLFADNKPLNINLFYNAKVINKDRVEKAQYHSARLYLENDNGKVDSFNIRIKTRGLYRRKTSNCYFPPLKLNFRKSEIQNTVFMGNDKLKLVMPCRKNKQYQQYVLLEYLAYKIYNLITPYSYKVRLINVKLIDTKDKKPTFENYAFLIEPDESLAKRNNCKEIEIRNIHPNQTDYKLINQLSLFQYLIGNTDWSVKALHNIKLLWRDSLQKPVAVPYDFDFSGLVNAPYALPAEHLSISTVRTRYYNGYARSLDELEANLLIFKEKKEEIYALVHSIDGLDQKYIDETIEYFDQFYLIPDHPERIQHEFIEKCRKD